MRREGHLALTERISRHLSSLERRTFDKNHRILDFKQVFQFDSPQIFKFHLKKIRKMQTILLLFWISASKCFISSNNYEISKNLKRTI